MLTVTVKTLDSSDHLFDNVPGDITVKDFKEKIKNRVNVEPDQQRLIFCGRVMADSSLLSSYDVDGKVIHLVQRMPPSLDGVTESSRRSQQRGDARARTRVHRSLGSETRSGGRPNVRHSVNVISGHSSSEVRMQSISQIIGYVSGLIFQTLPELLTDLGLYEATLEAEVSASFNNAMDILANQRRIRQNVAVQGAEPGYDAGRSNEVGGSRDDAMDVEGGDSTAAESDNLMDVESSPTVEADNGSQADIASRPADSSGRASGQQQRHQALPFGMDGAMLLAIRVDESSGRVLSSSSQWIPQGPQQSGGQSGTSGIAIDGAGSLNRPANPTIDYLHALTDLYWQIHSVFQRQWSAFETGVLYVSDETRRSLSVDLRRRQQNVYDVLCHVMHSLAHILHNLSDLQINFIRPQVYVGPFAPANEDNQTETPSDEPLRVHAPPFRLTQSAIFMPVGVSLSPNDIDGSQVNLSAVRDANAQPMEAMFGVQPAQSGSSPNLNRNPPLLVQNVVHRLGRSSSAFPRVAVHRRSSSVAAPSVNSSNEQSSTGQPSASETEPERPRLPQFRPFDGWASGSSSAPFDAFLRCQSRHIARSGDTSNSRRRAVIVPTSGIQAGGVRQQGSASNRPANNMQSPSGEGQRRQQQQQSSTPPNVMGSVMNTIQSMLGSMTGAGTSASFHVVDTSNGERSQPLTVRDWMQQFFIFEPEDSSSSSISGRLLTEIASRLLLVDLLALVGLGQMTDNVVSSLQEFRDNIRPVFRRIMTETCGSSNSIDAFVTAIMTSRNAADGELSITDDLNRMAESVIEDARPDVNLAASWNLYIHVILVRLTRLVLLLDCTSQTFASVARDIISQIPSNLVRLTHLCLADSNRLGPVIDAIVGQRIRREFVEESEADSDQHFYVPPGLETWIESASMAYSRTLVTRVTNGSSPVEDDNMRQFVKLRGNVRDAPIEDERPRPTSASSSRRSSNTVRQPGPSSAPGQADLEWIFHNADRVSIPASLAGGLEQWTSVIEHDRSMPARSISDTIDNQSGVRSQPKSEEATTSRTMDGTARNNLRSTSVSALQAAIAQIVPGQTSADLSIIERVIGNEDDGDAVLTAVRQYVLDVMRGRTANMVDLSDEVQNFLNSIGR